MNESERIQRLKDPVAKQQAFEELITEFRYFVYCRAKRIVLDHDDADDVVQNSFIKAWRNLDRFRGESTLKTWLYRIVTNEALTFISKKKKRQTVDISVFEEWKTLGHSLGDGFTGDEIMQKLEMAVSELPEKQKQVFELKYFEDLSYEEMAELLGGTVGSLKASFHHAVKKIEIFLKKD